MKFSLKLSKIFSKNWVKFFTYFIGPSDGTVSRCTLRLKIYEATSAWFPLTLLSLYFQFSGLLNYVMNHKGDNFKVQERWHEKLNRWDTALESYEKRLAENPNDVELSLGQMRCLEALGEWWVLNFLGVRGFERRILNAILRKDFSFESKEVLKSISWKELRVRAPISYMWVLKNWDGVSLNPKMFSFQQFLLTCNKSGQDPESERI